jgi:Tol biopolymer transport system component/tRNA A-37 threonylcarbamoyl transferase component Bud32
MLEAGKRLGPYEIVSPIGAGGMGQVYRARDTRLDRTVAVKILTDGLAQNAQLRARFEREAKAISALGHPHICTIHDIGNENGLDYLVMEYIEGETLTARLARGPLQPAEVIRYGIQLADALEKAHRNGIVHRDVKPSNIMITRSGAKLLDFGLAKSSEPAAVTATQVLAVDRALPTEQKPLTEQGMIVGTFQYMSPEQLEGRELDGRSDIFALGAVLYEMATGRRAFDGKTKTSLIAAILATEPPPISTMQPLTPEPLDRVIRIALTKDPDERWQSAHDLRLELEGIELTAAQAAPARASRRVVWSGWIAALAFVVAAAAVALWHWRTDHASAPKPTRVMIAPAEGHFFNVGDAGAMISPASDDLLIRVSSDKEDQLFLRSLDSFELRPVGNSGGAYDTFWSADGKQIGFFLNGRLLRADLSGRSPRALLTAGDSRGGAIAADGTTLVSPRSTGPIFRLDESGALHPVTRLDSARKETGHWRPAFLPDGRHFLYTARSSIAEQSATYVASLDSPVPKRILDVDSTVFYVHPGYLLYVDGDKLYAQAFDPDKLERRGDPHLLAEHVAFEPRWGTPGYSANGHTLVYMEQPQSRSAALSRFDRKARERTPIPDANGFNLDLSRDEAWLAMDVDDAAVHTDDIWVKDLKRGTLTRITYDPGPDVGPVWSPDSRWIVWTSERGGTLQILRRLASGVGQEEVLLTLNQAERDRQKIFGLEVCDWSRDGRFLLLELYTADQRVDLALIDLNEKEHSIQRIIATPFQENSGRFSFDGKWIAYVSDESGTDQIYVQPLPITGAKWQVSTDGGDAPRWRADGREIFFINRGRNLCSVNIETHGSELVLSKPSVVADQIPADYVAFGDGMSFISSDRQRPTAAPLFVIQNWRAAIEKN